MTQCKKIWPWKISLIAALTPKRGIGKSCNLPWPHLPTDFRYFSFITQQVSGTLTSPKQNAVIMGKLTWESLPGTAKPLCNRINIVVSSTLNSQDLAKDKTEIPVNTHVCKTIESALDLLRTQYDDKINQVFLVGGSSIYREGIESGFVERMYLTRIGVEFECDTFFPSFGKIIPLEPGSKDEVQREESGLWACKTDGFAITYISHTYSNKGIPFDFVLLEREQLEPIQQLNANKDVDEGKLAMLEFENQQSLNKVCGKQNRIRAIPNVSVRHHEEIQYLDLIAKIMNEGSENPDRTGVGIISTFGNIMRFSLEASFPLLTTKRVFWRGVVEELLWFLRGDTNANHLTDIGVTIWEKNATREFLDSQGLTSREVGDIGPVYGFQWRHFGAEYVDMHTDYSGKGVDQIKQVIEQIKTDPTSRRILLCAWNPAALHLMALPPCHVMCQFYVNNGELSCLMFQRSADVGLGVPFNIASYSLLTVMIAHICNLKPKEFVHFFGNTHIYNNHIDPLKKQIQREPRPFPTLTIKRQVKEIDEFVADDFVLSGYNPHPTIKMEMAV